MLWFACFEFLAGFVVCLLLRCFMLDCVCWFGVVTGHVCLGLVDFVWVGLVVLCLLFG